MAGTTRRSISIKGATYEHLKAKAAEKGTTVSGLVEEMVAEKLNELGIQEETALEPKPKRQPDPKPRVTSSFTF